MNPIGAGRWQRLAALLGANLALAMGPWSVRLADSGPIAAGFWRLLLPLPLLFGLAIGNRQRLTGYTRSMALVIVVAGLLFGADLASWHVGIGLTRLGNATLLGNCASPIVMVWGILTARRRPRTGEWLAIGAVTAGSLLLLGRSLEIGRATLAGDLFCVLAGVFYAGYIILAQSLREKLGNWALLAWVCVSALPLMLVAALLKGEPVWPHTWWPLFALALGSQVIGQGLLVYSLGNFPPLVIGVSLLTQPVLAVTIGWLGFGETLGLTDALGMALIGAALVLARTTVAPEDSPPVPAPAPT